jgi:hypothetical protein
VFGITELRRMLSPNRERERAREKKGQKNGEYSIIASLRILSRVSVTLDRVCVDDWIY